MQHFRDRHELRAEQLTEPRMVNTPRGQVFAKSSDWICHDVEGQVWVVTDELFTKHYEPVPPPVGRQDDIYGKKIIVFDFDWTLHQLDEWRGAHVCDGDPVDGAIPFLYRIVNAEQFHVAIYSTRSAQTGGREAMCAWLNQQDTLLRQAATAECAETGATLQLFPDALLGDRCFYPLSKPPAWIFFDDRAVTAQGQATWSAWPLDRIEQGIGA